MDYPYSLVLSILFGLAGELSILRLQPDDRTWELLAHTTETQTTSYGLLYREATGSKETGIEIHHLIKTKQPKIVVNELGCITEAQISRLYRVIEAYLKGV